MFHEAPATGGAAPDAEATAGDMADSIESATKHHRTHGDMDGSTCLLSKCALHYPMAYAIDEAADLRARLEAVEGREQALLGLMLEAEGLFPDGMRPGGWRAALAKEATK